MWIARHEPTGWDPLGNWTIVVNWGEIAKQMSKMIGLMFPKELVNIIVLYASPLTAFVQQDVPTKTKKWNDKNNKWFLGKESRVIEWDYSPNPSPIGIAKKLLEIMMDDSRSRSLFMYLKQLAEFVPFPYRWDKLVWSEFQRKIIHYHHDSEIQRWFHEYCPLDNF